MNYFTKKLVVPVSGAIVTAIGTGLLAYGMADGMPSRAALSFVIAGTSSFLGGWILLLIGGTQPPAETPRQMPKVNNYFQLQERTNDKILYVRGAGNYISGDIIDIPVDFEKLQKVARHSIRNKPFSFARLGAIGLSRRDVEKLQSWAAGKEYIRQKDSQSIQAGYVVTDAGKQFFVDVLATSPTGQQKYRYTHDG